MIEQYVDSLSTYAADIDGVFTLIFWLVAFWTTLCFAAFFYLLWKFKARPGQKAQYVTGETKDEKRWVTIPHFLVLICDVFIIIAAVQVWYKVKQDKPDPERSIQVIAQQWGWTFVDPGPDGILSGTRDDGSDATDDNIVTVDDLYIEQDMVYHFELESLDVLHDFSVPVFRLKQDAIPGRVIKGWFEATGIGERGFMMKDPIIGEHMVYDIQCAEMCGIGHGIMRARIHILDKETYAKWQAGMVAQNQQLALK